MSVSLASGSNVICASSFVVTVSSTATGGSSCAATVIDTEAVEPPGASVYVNVSLPVKFAAGAYVTVPFAASTTVPCDGCETAEIEIGPASTSVSFASRSSAVAGASSATVIVSATATGASSTHVTLTVTVASEPPLTV